MIDSIPRPDASLPEFLAARARHASDSRLVLDAVGGFTLAASAVLWGGPGWIILTAAGACFFGFGCWGIADRELGERAGTGPEYARRLLEMACLVSCVIGAVACVALLLSLLGLALGRLIS